MGTADLLHALLAAIAAWAVLSDRPQRTTRTNPRPTFARPPAPAGPPSLHNTSQRAAAPKDTQ